MLSAGGGKTSAKGECTLPVVLLHCVRKESSWGGKCVCVCVCMRAHACAHLSVLGSKTALCQQPLVFFFYIYRISAALDSTTFFRRNAPPSTLLIQVWEFGLSPTHTRIGGNAIQDNKNPFLEPSNPREERHSLLSDKAEDVSWKPLAPWAVAVP